MSNLFTVHTLTWHHKSYTLLCVTRGHLHTLIGLGFLDPPESLMSKCYAVLRKLTMSLCITHNKWPETNVERIVIKFIQHIIKDESSMKNGFLTQQRVTRYRVCACNVTMLNRHQQLQMCQKHTRVSSESMPTCVEWKNAYVCRVKVCLCASSESIPICVECEIGLCVSGVK